VDVGYFQYRRSRRAKLAALLLFALLGTAFSTSSLAAHKTHTVVIEGMAFSPNRLELAPGDTVVWQNKDIVQHNATATDGSFKSPTIEPNRSWKTTVRGKAREIPYTCTLHPTMKATLVVK
jgi:plastocyanin